MAFTYDAGLRIRPPEPMPECIDGESPQDYTARVLAQCSLESATTAENASGDSAPTPFNIGQIQADVAQAEQDIVDLEARVTTNTTDITALQESTAALTTQFLTGIQYYESGDTSVDITFPNAADWKLFIQPVDRALASVYVSFDDESFTVHFSAAGADGYFNWFAIKE